MSAAVRLGLNSQSSFVHKKDGRVQSEGFTSLVRCGKGFKHYKSTCVKLL